MRRDNLQFGISEEKLWLQDITLETTVTGLYPKDHVPGLFVPVRRNSSCMCIVLIDIREITAMILKDKTRGCVLHITNQEERYLPCLTNDDGSPDCLCMDIEPVKENLCVDFVGDTCVPGIICACQELSDYLDRHINKHKKNYGYKI